MDQSASRIPTTSVMDRVPFQRDRRQHPPGFTPNSKNERLALAPHPTPVLQNSLSAVTGPTGQSG